MVTNPNPYTKFSEPKEPYKTPFFKIQPPIGKNIYSTNYYM